MQLLYTGARPTDGNHPHILEIKMSFDRRTIAKPQQLHTRVGAFKLFSVAGLVVGLSASAAVAQTASTTASTNSTVQSDGSRSAHQNVLVGKPLQAKLGQEGPIEYVVEHPSWRESKAVRVVDPNRPHLNIEKTVFARLVVSVESEDILKGAINSVSKALGSDRPGSHQYRPYLNQSTVFVVEAISVEDAINLANELTKLDGVDWAEVDHKNKVQNKIITTDPLAPFQWHVSNTAFTAPLDNDHGVDAVYDMGYTGSGVVVGILEAFENSFYHIDEMGAQFIHPDLANKLNAELSIDTAPFDIEYSHGVSVAGLVASEGDNGIAGAGVAYGAQLASLNNSSQIASGESLGHALADIDIVNNSWGPVNESFPLSPTGKVLVNFPDDFEIDIPQVTHSGISRIRQIGLDQGIRLGRGRKGRVFVFSAGNSNHFMGFDRLRTGNVISLPGIGTDDMVPQYGYLDITGTDPSQTDGDGDGIPDVFNIDGTISLSNRWSGHLGDRVEYSQMAGLSRTLAIASVGMSNTISGYSTTGTSVLAAAYSQDFGLSTEFTPGGGSWGGGPTGLGLVTLSQAAAGAAACNAQYSTSAFSGSPTTCQFNGTSAAAPVASGIFALMLEANPELTLRDIQHIIQQTSTVVNFDPTHSYWAAPVLGLGSLDSDDDPNNPTPTFWTTNDAHVRHSDEYGFGIIDAEAAVAAAATYGGSGQLILLDSGQVNDGDDNFFENGDIEDATFEQIAVISENLETNQLIPGTRVTFDLNCVRENIVVEGVELTLTIQGDGAGDLLIALQSPRGTVSPLALPRGDSNGLNGFSYANYTFSTYKNWGELSGGQWSMVIQDFRPDEDSPEGDPPTDPMPPMPDQSDFGVEQVTWLGTFGLPGNPDHTEKVVVGYRLKIYGTDIGAPVFEGCNPLGTSCPGDLDGSGFIDIVDFQIYISWFMDSNFLADLDGDTDIDFTDLLIYRSLWIPGFCDRANNPFAGGRPHPGSTNGGGGDNDPVVRPI